MVLGTVRPRRKEASKGSLRLVPGKFASWQKGLMLLFPQKVLSVEGGMLGFVALAHWAPVCSVQRCSETTQFS